MSVVQMDELGPLHIGEASKVTVKVWLMICIEVVTREVHLCVMRDQSTPSFIRTLEILQAKCGLYTTIVLNHASAHCTVHKRHCAPTINRIVNSDDIDVLPPHGIKFVIAESNRHKKVGLAEKVCL